MWCLLPLACHREPPGDDGGTPATPTDSAPTAPTDTAPPDPIDTGATAATGDTAAPAPPDDPFLAGDPADLVGIVDLTWTPLAEPGRWVATVLTFERGKYRLSGRIVAPGAGLDSCEVRTGDVALELRYRDAGDVALTAGAVVLPVPPVVPGVGGVYQALGAFEDADPRGLAWDLSTTGADLPALALRAPVTFPTGELALEPLPEVVDAADGLRLTWTAPDADELMITLYAGNATVRCAAGNDGAFEVPEPILAALPTGEVVFWAWTGRLGAAPAPDGSWVQYQAGHAIEGTFRLR